MRVARYLAPVAVAGAVLVWCLALGGVPRKAAQASTKLTNQRLQPKPTVVAPLVEFVDEKIQLQGRYEVATPDRATIGSVAPAVLKDILVKPGDRVKKGQVVARVALGSSGRTFVPRFDARSESAYAEELSNALGSALSDHEASLKEAQAAYDMAKRSHDARVARAKSELDEIQNGPPADRLADAQGNVDALRSVRDKAKALSDRDARAYDQGWISRNQATASKQALGAAETALTKAEEQLQDVKKARSQSEMRAAKTSFASVKATEDEKLADAASELDRVKNGGLAFGKGTVPPPSFSSPIDSGLRGKIARTVPIKSPFDGTVVKPITAGSIVEIVKDGAKGEFVAQTDSATARKLRAGMVVRLPNGDAGFLKSVSKPDPKTNLVTIRVPVSTLAKPLEGATAVVMLRKSGR